MNNKRNQFGFGEERILGAVKDSAMYVLEKFNAAQDKELSNTSEIFDNEKLNDGSVGMENVHKNVRVRTSDVLSPNVQRDDYQYDQNISSNEPSYYQESSFTRDSSNTLGSSFVLIIAAVLALIIMVAVVTLGILKIIGR